MAFKDELAYQQGVKACKQGYYRYDFNPYPDGSCEQALWDTGYGHQSKGLLNEDLTYKKG